MKINLKYIQDLSIRAKSLKLLEESIEVNLHDHGFDNGFLDTLQNSKQQQQNRIYQN